MGVLNTYEVSLSQKMGCEMSFSLYPWKGNKIYGYFGLSVQRKDLRACDSLRFII